MTEIKEVETEGTNQAGTNRMENEEQSKEQYEETEYQGLKLIKISWWHCIYVLGVLVGLIYKLMPMAKNVALGEHLGIQLAVVIFSTVAQRYLLYASLIGCALTFYRNKMPKIYIFYTSAVIVLFIASLGLFLV